MALPLLGAAKLLGGQMVKKTAAGAAKKALTGAAKDKAKDFITGKKKKKGAIVKAQKAEVVGVSDRRLQERSDIVITPTSTIVPTRKDEDTSANVAETKKRVDFSSLEKQVNNIVSLTESLKKISTADLKEEKKRDKKLRARVDKENKKERESKLELGKMLSGAGGAIVGAAKKFNILDFFKNILLGSLILNLLNIIKEIPKMLESLAANLKAIFFGIRIAFSLLRNIKGAPRGLFNVVKGLVKGAFGLIGKGIRGIGNLIGSGFRKIVSVIGNRIKKLLGIKPDLPSKPGPKGVGGKGKSGLSRKQRTKIKQNNLRKRNQQKKKVASAKARLSEKKPKPTTTKPTKPARVSPTKPKAPTAAKVAPKAPQTVAPPKNNLIKKLFGIQKKEDLAALRQAKKPLQLGSKFAKNLRIPIIGPVLTFVASVLAGDELGMSFYKAIGAGIGEMVGFAAGALLGGIGAPIGAMLGSYVGEAGGQIAYGLVNGGIEGAKAELDKIIETFITNAQNTWEWVSGGFKRFYESLDRYKLNMQWAKSANPFIKTLIPGLDLLGALDGLEIPMPGQFFKVLQGDFEIFGKAVRAFFDGDNFNMQGRLEPLGGPLREKISDFTSKEANDRLAEIQSMESLFKQRIAEGELGETVIKGVGKVVIKKEGGRSKVIVTRYYDENGKEMTSIDFNNKLVEVKSQLQEQKISAVTPVTPATSLSSGGGGASSAVAGTPEQKKMLDAISFAEGTTKSYGTLYGGKVIPELAAGQMTIAQVLQMQKSKMYKGESVYGSGYDSNATGRYQFMSYVLEEEIGIQGVDPSELFTPEMQDRLILNRISRMRGVTPELLAAEGMSDKVIDMLAPEFASFPNLFGPDAKGRVGTNTSYYGQGGKSKEEIKRAYGASTGEASAIQTTDAPAPPAPGVIPNENLLPGYAPPGSDNQPRVQPREGMVSTPSSSMGAFNTGLKTGASQYIGGSSEYHIDTQFKSSMSMEEKVKMMDQLAAGYAAQGRKIEFSNAAVAGEIYDPGASYEAKADLLQRAFHAHQIPRGRAIDAGGFNRIDYYAPLIDETRFGSSVEGQDILIPTIGGTKVEYASGGDYGAFVELKDDQGNTILRTGHGDIRYAKTGSQRLDPSATIQTPQVTPAQVAPSQVEPKIGQRAGEIQTYADYETPGGTVIMVQQPGQVSSPGGVPMGKGKSGQVLPMYPPMSTILNSYYKQQVKSFLYKRG